MPKPTFFNLPPDKQDNIIQAAMTEFAQNPFKKVTIDNMVNRAGIPKGSFYQYFDNKDDVYRYIFKTLTEEKKEVLASVYGAMETLDFRDFMVLLCTTGAQFDTRSLNQMDLRDRFLHQCNAELRDDILTMMKDQSNALLEVVLTHYVKTGRLRADLDIPFTAELFTLLIIGLTRDIGPQVEDPKALALERIEKLLDLMEQGIVE